MSRKKQNTQKAMVAHIAYRFYGVPTAYSLVPIVLHEVDIDREINTELVEMGVRKPRDWKLIFTSTGWLVACIILVAIRDLFPATRFVVNLIVIGWVLYWGVTILQAFFKILFLSRHK